MKELRMCDYCAKVIQAPFPRICPKCHTVTKWRTKEQCMQDTLTAELRAWEFEEKKFVKKR